MGIDGVKAPESIVEKSASSVEDKATEEVKATSDGQEHNEL
jgi:hypothetical protein